MGGFYSENITAGSNKSVQDAVKSWQGDAPHLNTMLSPDLTEIGVGVVLVGDYVYYVVDCARPTKSRQPQELTPSVGSSPAGGPTVAVPIPIKTLVPSTPLADGKVIHIVKPGETLWLIAISYKVKIIDLRKWNNLSDTEDIYPGNKLFIKISDMSPTMTLQATKTIFSPTAVPTRTREIIPTVTLTSAALRTPAASSKFQLKPDFWVLVVIVGAALILAYVFVKAGIIDK
jgi:LysM repeat protein